MKRKRGRPKIHEDRRKYMTEYMREYRKRKKVLIIHNESELYALLCNDAFVWNPESFPKVRFSKELIESCKFEVEEVKTE